MSELRYAYDLYPRDDPLGGARILRFSDLEEAEWNAEANGTGSGVIILPGDSADADSIDPRGLQYIRVVEIDPDDPDGGTDSGFAERVVHGFFLDTGSFDALTEQNTKKLTFGGAGTLSYWARAVMAPHTYIHAVFTGQDPFDRTWRLDQQSTVYANGNYTGAMLWRVLYELSHFRSGATYTHKHADGIIYTDAHDDDRTESAVPDAVIDFTAFLDSNGNAWTEKVGEFRVGVLDNGLSVIRLLMELGAYVEMDPDTFETRAYQASSHRRDRTGGAWGASVIRFQSPTDGTLDTGNILSDAKRALTAHIQRSTMWAGGGDDTYAKATGTFDIPWEGGLNSDANDLDALEVQADRQITARSDAGDTLRVRSVPIDDPASGFYRPLHSTGVLLDDLATVHNGSGQWDFDEQTFPVAGVGGKLREGGDWDTFFDLGASFRPMEGRQFQVAPLNSHTHPPNLCQPGQPPTVESGGWLSTSPGAIVVPDDLTDSILIVFGQGGPGPGNPGGLPYTATLGATSLTAIAGSSIADSPANMQAFYLLNPPADPGAAGAQLSVLDGFIPSGQYKGYIVLSGVNQSDPIGSVVTASGTGTAAGSGAISGGGMPINAVFGVGSPTGASDPTPGGGQVSAWIFNAASGIIPSGHIETGGGSAGANPTWTLSQSKDWVAIGLSVNGTGANDCPADVGDSCEVGTATRAARCDHVHAHPLLTAGTYHDADSISFTPAGSIAATNVQAAIVEHDADATLHPGAGAPTAADYLVGTAQAGLSAEIVVGATPGGELGGTWAAPTVDATHSGSAHHTESHQARHANGGADEVAVEGLPTAETDTALVLHPDGAGGIEWGTDEGGSGIAGELVTDTIIGDGVEDTFALSETPTGSWALVSTNGADLLPTEYAIVAGDIVFDVAPVNLSESLVTFITGGFTVPATDPLDIVDPTIATAEDVALKLNALMANLRTAGIIA